jgi:flavodoxin
MKVTVVYGSRYGNTARITQAIAAKLEASGSVRQVEAPDPTAFDLEGVDLPVVGGPTEGHGVSESLRARLNQLPVGALQGRTAAAFDTRSNWPELLSGSAAHGIARSVQQRGARLVVPPESFLIHGLKEPNLLPGEIERASAWAEQLASALSAGPPAARA